MRWTDFLWQRREENVDDYHKWRESLFYSYSVFISKIVRTKIPSWAQNDTCKMLTRSPEEPGANTAQSDMSSGLNKVLSENLNRSLYPPSAHEGKQKHASSFAHYSSQFVRHRALKNAKTCYCSYSMQTNMMVYTLTHNPQPSRRCHSSRAQRWLNSRLSRQHWTIIYLKTILSKIEWEGLANVAPTETSTEVKAGTAALLLQSSCCG